jgi:2-succinyl-5-enolpyruvyl-6-hydroxy-3-cyclohexene-1-carboxylate synthase
MEGISMSKNQTEPIAFRIPRGVPDISHPSVEKKSDAPGTSSSDGMEHVTVGGGNQSQQSEVASDNKRSDAHDARSEQAPVPVPERVAIPDPKREAQSERTSIPTPVANTHNEDAKDRALKTYGSDSDGKKLPTATPVPSSQAHSFRTSPVGFKRETEQQADASSSSALNNDGADKAKVASAPDKQVAEAVSTAKSEQSRTQSSAPRALVGNESLDHGRMMGEVSDHDHASVPSNSETAHADNSMRLSADRADQSAADATNNQQAQAEREPVQNHDASTVSHPSSDRAAYDDGATHETTHHTDDAHEAHAAHEFHEPRDIDSASRPERTHAQADPSVTAEFLDVFFAELEHCGVTNVVVSPGSRSTALAMKAFERFHDVYVDVDERGAAFFALGLAKATHAPVVVICTSGTAVANWMPAVLESESSRVPLIFLSGDRPPRLQQLGAPQTCDQMKIFTDHVRRFVQMPLPANDDDTLNFVRQTALEACISAHGSVPGGVSCDAGPVHINFPFEAPLKPAKGIADIDSQLPATVIPGQGLMPCDAHGILNLIKGHRVIAVCGEGTCSSNLDAQALIAFAHRRSIPLLADPLSGLRQFDDPLIIDNYDSFLKEEEPPCIDIVIRFGRWPVSKRCCETIECSDPLQIVVDARDTRDYHATTDLFVRTTASVFAHALCDGGGSGMASSSCAQAWVDRNDETRERIQAVQYAPGMNDFEGAYVHALLDVIPSQSLLYSASSMSIRALDTFYCRVDKPLTVLCNRGLNGIDGTLSSALGAAQMFDQSTLLIGDLALLHDANAFALQGEFQRRAVRGTRAMPSVIVILLDNGGGGIFDMLPQRSEEDYFERLFLTPQKVDFRRLAQAFDVEYRPVNTVQEFMRTYRGLLGTPGISLIDVTVPLAGIAKRYEPYW